jgi:hypothetical protein
VKDVPNSLLRNIKLENNDMKPVTNSRDTQEIPFEKGKQVLKVFHTYNHSSSIFDDFDHYEKVQNADEQHKQQNNHYQKQPIGNEQKTAEPDHHSEMTTSAGPYSSSSSSSATDSAQDPQNQQQQKQQETTHEQQPAHQTQFQQKIATA